MKKQFDAHLGSERTSEKSGKKNDNRTLGYFGMKHSIICLNLFLPQFKSNYNQREAQRNRNNFLTRSKYLNHLFSFIFIIL